MATGEVCLTLCRFILTGKRSHQRELHGQALCHSLETSGGRGQISRVFTLSVFATILLTTLIQAGCVGVTSLKGNATTSTDPSGSTVLGASPTALDFGNVLLGNTSNQSLTIANFGTTAVTISQTSASGTGLAVGGVTLPVDLNPGSSVTFTASFAPATVGDVTGTISFTSQQLRQTFGVGWHGTGKAAAPIISVQPISQSILAGQTATFSVTAKGTAPLAYQWQKNGVTITGATSSSYTSPSETTSDTGAQFTVIVSNSAGNVISNAATLTVGSTPVAPSITNQPTNQTTFANQTATFSVAATGTSPLSYQWRKNGAPISGGTSSSYTTPPETTSDSGALFSVVISNSAGTMTSGNASLTVNPDPVAPSITSQPASHTIIAGQTATFSVTASGTSPLSYQWQKNGAPISGANASSYTTPAETTTDNGAQFAVVVSNSAGSATSNSVTLTVNAATQLISASPSSLGFGNVNTGSNSVLPVVLTNSGNSNVTISSVSVSGAGFSASGISAGQIIAPTKTATLNVTFAPAATGSVTGSVSVLSNASNSPATIGLSGAGVAPVTYRISGTLSGAGGAGATVSLSGSSTATTLASASGSYSFTVLNGSYTVTPSNAGYSFSPASQPATVNNGNVSNINFTASTASGTCATSTTAGWCQVPNINMANLFQPFSGQQGNTNSLDSTLNGNVINAWSGAALNPSTNTMILWGGGHTDYNGNEVYEVNFGANPITMTRATNPTPNPNGSGSSTSCPAAAVTGIPNGRHTYNGLVYVPSISRMMAINGAIACSSGAGAVPPDEWLFNDGNNGWSQINYSGTEPGHVNSTNYQVGNVLLYDSNSDKVYASDHCFDYSTVPGTWAWTELDNTCTNSTEMAGVIDPQRKKYILFGDSANSAGYYEAEDRKSTRLN